MLHRSNKHRSNLTNIRMSQSRWFMEKTVLLLSIVFFLFSIVYLLTGLYVFLKSPRERINQVFCSSFIIKPMDVWLYHCHLRQWLRKLFILATLFSPGVGSIFCCTLTFYTITDRKKRTAQAMVDLSVYLFSCRSFCFCLFSF